MVKSNYEKDDEKRDSDKTSKNYDVLLSIIFRRFQTSYDKTFFDFKVSRRGRLEFKQERAFSKFRIALTNRSGVVKCAIIDIYNHVIGKTLYQQNFPIELSTAKPKDIQKISSTIFRWIEAQMKKI